MGLREDKKAKTRKAISDIATRLFIERGYHAVTTAEIAALADISPATLFNYFPTKEALVFDEDDAMEAGLVDAIVLRPADTTILESLKTYVLAGSCFRYSQDPGFGAFAKMVKTTPELTAYVRQMALRYEAAVTEAILSQWQNRFHASPGHGPGALCSGSHEPGAEQFRSFGNVYLAAGSVEIRNGYLTMSLTLLTFANLFFLGLLAGTEFIVRFGVRNPLNVLEPQPQIRLRQALIRQMRVPVPILFLLSTASSLGVTWLDRAGTGFLPRCAAMAFILVWILATFAGTVPINKKVLAWTPDEPPGTWRKTIRLWEGPGHPACRDSDTRLCLHADGGSVRGWGLISRRTVARNQLMEPAAHLPAGPRLRSSWRLVTDESRSRQSWRHVRRSFPQGRCHHRYDTGFANNP